MNPPPPYAAAPEAEACHSTIEQTPVHWHPKITPFRLFVLLSTIVLGTVKAAFAYLGQAMVSTTVEWIGGIVFTLLVFFLEQWEVHKSYPKNLEWFFAFDCANLIWRAIHTQQPMYRSDESGTEPTSKVAVTGYRLMVSATVAALGLGKATLAYLGHNTTANTFDWALGVLVTCFFYCIGFYESNAAGFAPTFFAHDQSLVIIRNIMTFITILAQAVGMYACTEWFNLTISFFHYATSDFGEDGPSPFGIDILLRSLRILMLCGAFVCGLCNLLGFALVSVLFLLTLQQELQRAICFLFKPATSSRLIRWASSTTQRSIMPLQQPFSHILQVGIPSLWLFAHLFGILFLTAYSFFMAGFAIAIGNEVWKGVTLDWIIIVTGVLFLYVTFRLFEILFYLLLSFITMVRNPAESYSTSPLLWTDE